MTFPMLALMFVAAGFQLRVAGKITRRAGLRGHRAVLAAFVLANALGLAFELAYAAIDDQFGEMSFGLDALVRAAAFAPWLVLDWRRAAQTQDPYASPERGLWLGLLYTAFTLPWVVLVAGFVAGEVMRPRVSEAAVALATEADAQAGTCASPAACHASVSRFVARVERGDITIRALAITLWVQGRVGDGALSPADARFVIGYLDLVEARDGQPPDAATIEALDE